MKQIFTLYFSLAGFVAQAQTPTFSWAQQRSIRYTTNFFTPDRSSIHVEVAPDQSVWVASLDSMTKSYSTIYLGAWSVDRISSGGILLNHKQLQGNVNLTQVKTSPNGNLYILGSFLDSVSFDGQNTMTTGDNAPHAFLACFGNNGDLIYTHELTLLLPDMASYMPQAMEVADGFVLLGYRSTNGSVVRQINPNTVLSPIVTQNQVSSLNSMLVRSDGTIVTTGSCANTACTFNGVAFTPPTNFYNQYIAVYPPSGAPKVLFIKDVTCPESQVAEAPDGDIYWTGELHDAATLLGNTLIGPATGSSLDYFLARINFNDAAPVLKWIWEVPTGQQTGSGLGKFKSIQTDEEGNLYSVGATSGTINWGQGHQTTAGIATSLVTLRRNANGEAAWVRSIASGLGAISGHTLSAGSDGSLYISGMTRGTVTFDGTTLPQQADNKYFHFVARLGNATATSRNPNLRSVWSLEPNPVSDFLTIMGEGDYSVSVLDMIGREVITSFAARGNIRLPMVDKPAGTYLVRIITRDQPAVTKMVVKR